MNFRLVWVGSDENPNTHSESANGMAAPPDLRVAGVRYERRGREMVRRQLQSGRLKITPLANFTARIIADLVFDDDAQLRRQLKVEAEVGEQKVAFVIPTEEFSRMAWVLNRLGARAIVYPGQQQHARAAIQQLSGTIQQERIFTHLGWRKHASGWIYLHAGGAVGTNFGM